ncbi:unnamed protein product [Lepeophtheirus salmonis]|uniref:(salmon louse) hypothetical protein n=1 Tax=Lepeophtheirus salmonis TaxID=72036 RepID=A0A7R8HAK2_LEPSM|nr:unnamed protein product [Lepeophtheirus salmonis]CAF2968087.1 unnamed protein product [Lepeophtheirus salmonis]
MAWSLEQVTLSKQKKIVDQLIMLNSYCPFQLLKWCSKIPEVISHLPNELLNNKDITLLFDETKTLGYSWNPKEDSIYLFMDFNEDSKSLTKRGVLSESSRYFDPEGRFAPVLFIAKLIFQETWNWKIKWDDLLPSDQSERWLQWKRKLRLLKSFSVPRCVMKPNFNYKDAKLCVFGDASSKGWSAVLYVRFVLSDESIKVGFLTLRTRVRPLKEITIPRMELEAALLCAHLIEHFYQITLIKISRVRAWTESAVVFHWIQSEASNWKNLHYQLGTDHLRYYMPIMLESCLWST